MIRRIPARPDEPLFLYTNDKGERVPLTYYRLSKQLKTWMEDIAGTSKGWTLHGLRRGGASWCFKINISSEAIRLMGDWASDAYRTYLDVDVYKRAEAMEVFMANIDKLQYRLASNK